MRRHRLLACVLSVILAASAAMTGYAATENHSDGQQHTVNSDVVNNDSSKTAVTSVNEGTSVTVNGDVKSEGWGARSSDGGELTVNGDVDASRVGAIAAGSGSSTTVNGNVSGNGAESGNAASAQDGGTLTVDGNVTSASSTKSAAVSQNGSELTVTGNVENTDAVTTGDHVPNTVLVGDGSTADIGGDVKSTAYGASVSEGSTVNIGGSVESELRGVRAADSSTVTVGGDVNSHSGIGVTAKEESQVTVNGSVTSSATNGDEVAVKATELSTVTVNGSVESTDAAIISITGTVNVAGDVKGKGDENGPPVYAENNAKIDIKGDVDASGLNAIASVDGSSVSVGGSVTGESGGALQVFGSSVTVEGSVSMESGYVAGMTNDSKLTIKEDAKGKGGISISEVNPDKGTVVVLGTLTAEGNDGYCINVSSDATKKEEVMDKLPTIIVGELSSSNGQYVRAYDMSEGQKQDTKAVAEAIAEQILFYIDVQDPDNGNITLDSGTTKVEGYDVAHADDTVTVTVTADNGYEIKTVDGGKATAKKNEDGSWSFTVPKTGGVSISALMEAIRRVEEGSGSDEGSSNIYQTAPDQQKQAPAPYVSEKAADNSTIHVYGEAKAPDGTRAGAVFSDSEVQAGTVVVYAGEGKTAGLKDDAKAAIAAINGGDLAAVPGVDLNGKKAVGGTVAFGIVPDGVHDVPVSLYAADLPSGAVPHILFYNNMTQQWILIPATVNPVTGLVEFRLPEDGTAVVVY